MSAVRPLRRRHLRRRLRRTALRVLRLTRRHYFSMLSACVLAAAFMLALTDRGVTRHSTQAIAPAEGEIVTPTASTPPGATAIVNAAPVRSRVLVYYVVSTAEQQLELEAALLSHLPLHGPVGKAPLPPPTFYYFLQVRNEAEKAYARDLLNEFAALAPTEGYRLRVVDLR